MFIEILPIIPDNPDAGIEVGFQSHSMSVTEGQVALEVCLLYRSDDPLVEDAIVFVTSEDDTAISNHPGGGIHTSCLLHFIVTIPFISPDYIPFTTTIRIPASFQEESLLCFNVTIVDDPIVENEEQFFLLLYSLSVKILEGYGRLTVSILDNESEWFFPFISHKNIIPQYLPCIHNYIIIIIFHVYSTCL